MSSYGRIIQHKKTGSRADFHKWLYDPNSDSLSAIVELECGSIEVWSFDVLSFLEPLLLTIQDEKKGELIRESLPCSDLAFVKKEKGDSFKYGNPIFVDDKNIAFKAGLDYIRGYKHPAITLIQGNTEDKECRRIGADEEESE